MSGHTDVQCINQQMEYHSAFPGDRLRGIRPLSLASVKIPALRCFGVSVASRKSTATAQRQQILTRSAPKSCLPASAFPYEAVPAHSG